MERVSQAYELSHSIFNRKILYIHFDQQKSGPLKPVRGKGGASAPVASPLPMGLAFVNDFFTIEEFMLVVAPVMGNQGKMAENSKICTAISF